MRNRINLTLAQFHLDALTSKRCVVDEDLHFNRNSLEWRTHWNELHPILKFWKVKTVEAFEKKIDQEKTLRSKDKFVFGNRSETLTRLATLRSYLERNHAAYVYSDSHNHNLIIKELTSGERILDGQVETWQHYELTPMLNQNVIRVESYVKSDFRGTIGYSSYKHNVHKTEVPICEKTTPLIQFILEAYERSSVTQARIEFERIEEQKKREEIKRYLDEQLTKRHFKLKFGTDLETEPSDDHVDYRD